MPELPEVERARRLAHEEAVGKTIAAVEVQEDNIVYVNVEASDFAKRVQGKAVVDTGRHGKHFYLLLKDGPTILLHLGMTGNIRFEGKSCFQYRRGTEEQTVWPPKYWKFIITFKDTGTGVIDNEGQTTCRMAFTDPRRLARIRLVEDVLNEPPISKLGFDPILSMPSFEEFYMKLHKRSAPIKALLLDQEFSAGIGNYMADEILYQGRIHPAQPSKTLTVDEIQDVTNFAVSVNADYQKFPTTWLFHYRWNKGKKKKVTTHDGNEIIYETVGGRTTAIVPAVQTLRTVTKVKNEKHSPQPAKKVNADGVVASRPNLIRSPHKVEMEDKAVVAKRPPEAQIPSLDENGRLSLEAAKKVT
ncbi:DNA glycosylase/AP lyase [Basidiobolus meristosporus CBS 931.73]|uniref:DNA glycosylase/AP lyase n=1 Tax=Basidiobolus meristosporus CBS 931.73 TaxID=1314790 RepID=A0A1Y1Z5L2_9FUNG|nr:DNA glycosylase/AP lyase [Basidiobolus meristosporus CBS 931.73]|eukprot:ORY05540.1 DNA glycosylase/AP lyase [Basidiobolus meristosporus CBS 931.73]